MTNDGRPLSPHLQVYRWQLTMVLSIAHRATGVLLSAALVAFVGWLLAVATGSEPYATVQSMLGSLPGRLLLAGITFAFFYHLCNGVRHLVWDAGRWLDIPQVYASGWAVVVLSLLLSVIAWALLFGLGGAT